eukprot:IDg23746t1
MATSARKEMSKHMGSLRISRALRHAIPASADTSYEPGDQVLVWREKQVNNRIGEWLGPFIVHSFEPEKKLVLIQDTANGSPRPFNVTQVRKYHTPEELSRMHFAELHHSLDHFSSSDDDHDQQTYLTEIVDAKDPRATSKEISDAKKKEIRGLLERGTFKLILHEEVPSDANVLPGRFVL